MNCEESSALWYFDISISLFISFHLKIVKTRDRCLTKSKVGAGAGVVTSVCLTFGGAGGVKIVGAGAGAGA